jgi:hypothetical protein
VKAQNLLPFFVLVLVVAAPAYLRIFGSTGNPGCVVTYCVSIKETVSAGSDGSVLQPVLAAMSIIQVAAVVAAVSPSVVLLAALRRRVPFSALRKLTHLRSLESAPLHDHSVRAAVFWLPIESICAGRLTSEMLKAPNLFGAGRP